MFKTEEIIAIFDDMENLQKEDSNDDENEERSIKYSSDNVAFVFINNVTIAFNNIQIDDNIRFYIDDEATAAIAIANVEIIG